MAKKAKEESGANSYPAEICQSFYNRVRALQADAATEKGESMSRCKVISQDINTVYDEAKVAGIPKRVLKGMIKHQTLLEKAAAIREDMEDLLPDFDLIGEQLQLPLKLG